MEIDHEIQQCYLEELKTSDETLGVLLPNEETVSQRLTNPIVTTYIDTEKISFERLVFLHFITVVPTLTFLIMSIGFNAKTKLIQHKNIECTYCLIVSGFYKKRSREVSDYSNYSYNFIYT